MKIIFSHGKESGPNGKKIQLLSKVASNLGFETDSIDYRGMYDVKERVALLEKTLMDLGEEEVILVGSSMGGYVATVVASKFPVLGLFLMCPALYMEDYDVQTYDVKTKNITIVHGWSDEVIPFNNSIKFGLENSANVLLIEDNHKLENSPTILAQQFSFFLKSIISSK